MGKFARAAHERAQAALRRSWRALALMVVAAVMPAPNRNPPGRASRPGRPRTVL